MTIEISVLRVVQVVLTTIDMTTKNCGQATKGVRRMPRHQKAKKDAASCDKPRGGAHIFRSGDFRMGQPLPSNVGRLTDEYIVGVERTGRIETS